MEGVGNGIGLDHVADEAQGNDDGHGKESGQPFAAQALGNIVGRAAGDMSFGIAGLVQLGQHGLGEDSGHAEKGGYPHPENGAGTAHGNGRCRARQVARAHLGGNGRCQGLEGSHAVLAGLFAEERQVAEGIADYFAEFADLHELQAKRIINARAHQ